MEVNNYCWLIAGWVQFSVFHSVFAALWFKNYFKNLMGSSFKYYRPLYSLFATLSLFLAVYFHIKAPAGYVFEKSIGLKIASSVLGVTGLLMMYVSGRKYFMHISGLDVFFQSNAKNKLEQDGLHKLIRHPLYTGTLFFVWSIFLWQPFIKNGMSAALITIYVYIGTYFEEKKLVLEFGKQYELYKKQVPMFFPNFKKN